MLLVGGMSLPMSRWENLTNSEAYLKSIITLGFVYAT